MDHTTRRPTTGSSKRRPVPLAPITGSILLVLFVFIVLAVSLAGVYWYMAYGVEHEPPRSMQLSSITQPVFLSWKQNDAVSIDTTDPQNLLAALGFVHATKNAWQMMLWRQTAQGSLSTWFGPGVYSIDRFSRQLQFAVLARKTFDQLPGEQQRLLRAYTDGINAAFKGENAFRQDEFAILNVAPDPWEPWHTLAVERLFAWLSTRPLEQSTGAFESHAWLDSLAQDDLKLRNWLQVHSFEYSFAAVLPPVIEGERPSFYQRFTYGASALPLVQEIQIEQPDGSTRFLATIPGSLVFLASHSPPLNWALLPASEYSLSFSSDSSQFPPSFERIANRDGSEQLVTLHHRPGNIGLAHRGEAQSDSLLQLTWSGLEPGTDIFNFLNLIEGKASSFILQTGDRLVLDNNTWKVEGTPQSGRPLQNGLGVVVGSTPWLADVADHLDSLAQVSPELLDPREWSNNCYSRWAASRMNEFAPFFTPIPRFEKRTYYEALTYLRNWNYEYDASSIGASIFTTLNKQLDHTNGIPDSLLVVSSFEAAVETLLVQNGPDLSQWRFEITNPTFRFFPVWSSDSLFALAEPPLSQSRFAALQFAGVGHATTLCWGSPRTSPALPLSAHWESWSIRLNNQDNVFWNKHVVPDAFLDRYLITNRPGMVYRMNRPTRETAPSSTLLPLS